MKKSIALWMFISVFILDFMYSLYNFIPGFANRDDNFSVSFISLLHLVPLVALIVICAFLPKIQKKTKLSAIKIGLIIYLSLDVIFGFIVLRFRFPKYFGFLFYSSSWLFDIVCIIIRYNFYRLAIDFALDVIYWDAFGFLLAESSN